MYGFYVLCVGSLVLQMVAPYLVWASRWNVPTHVLLGFCLTAYIIPGLLTDVWSYFGQEIFFLYFYINCLGAMSMVVGIFVGSRWRGAKKLSKKVLPLFEPGMEFKISQRVKKVALVGIAGFVLAYIVMGFVPIFAADPLSAKQFKGEYRDAYYRAAYLYRFSFWVVFACIPLLLTCWWVNSRKYFLVLAIAGVGLIGASLARESTAVGIITFLGFLAAWKRWTKTYLLFVALIIPLGSSIYYLLSLFTGVDSFGNDAYGSGIFDTIAAGAPDIADQLMFLDGFSRLDGFTWGRTILGGLVPGNYMWNPSVWTLTYDDLGGDISETVSGGLRLTPALWGYVNFSWLGVVLLPFIAGWLNGYMLTALKRLPFKQSIIATAAVMILYMTLGKQIIGFYVLSIHSLPAIACAVYFCFYYKKRRRTLMESLETQRRRAQSL